MRVYLSGGIEHAPDRGKAWRARIAPPLRELGHDVYDPAADERKNLTEAEWRGFREWKQTDLERFRSAVRKIIAYDLDRLGESDCVLCYWDEHAQRGAGTAGELTVAQWRGMPVYLVLAMRVEQVSGWVLGCATEVFASLEEAVERLGARSEACLRG